MARETPASAETALLEVASLAARHIARRRDDPVSRPADPAALARRVRTMDFTEALPLGEAAEVLLDLMTAGGVRNDHPRYYGLFNPPPLTAAAAGDLLAGVVNPQLAVWSHAPGAVELELRLVELLAGRIWADRPGAGGFTSGGSEANHTALLLALARGCPDWARDGLPRTGPRLALYVSAESHLAWIKLARAVGLGDEAVRLVQAPDGLRLDRDTLERFIAHDEGFRPLMICATAGATAHGAVDDLAGLGAVARAHDAYYHVDAAWAGAVVLSDRHRPLLAGLEAADSVTLDAHKWLAVPMGAGLLLARDWAGLETCFAVSTAYMPSASRARRDPYIHSLQWSRRFTGAKLFMALATLGLQGYAAMIDRQVALGERLRDRLAQRGWEILNRTGLPLVVFAPPGADPAHVAAIAGAVEAGGKAWLSTVTISGRLGLRACITSFETTEADIDDLVTLLEPYRSPRPGGAATAQPPP